MKILFFSKLQVYLFSTFFIIIFFSFSLLFVFYYLPYVYLAHCIVSFKIPCRGDRTHFGQLYHIGQIK